MKLTPVWVCKNSGKSLYWLPKTNENGGNIKWYSLKACVTPPIQTHAFLNETFIAYYLTYFVYFVIFVRLTKPCGCNKALARQSCHDKHVMSAA